MPKGYRFAIFALGLVAGLGLALLFVVWTVPEFRNPLNQEINGGSADQYADHENPESPGNKPHWRHWAERLFATEDTLAQWVMAAFSVVATSISIWAIIWVRRTWRETKRGADAAWKAIKVSRKIGQAQVRAYLSIIESTLSVRADGSGVETRLQIKNFGNSPAKNVHIAYRVGIAVNLSDPQALRDSGPMVIPAWEQAFGQSIASGMAARFNHFHGNFPLTADEMNAIGTQALPPMFYATMTIRFLDVFDQENTETQHRSAMLQAVDTSLPLFQTHFHPLSWRIDRE